MGDFISVVVLLGAPLATQLVLEGEMCAQSVAKMVSRQPIPKSPQVAESDPKMYIKFIKSYSSRCFIVRKNGDHIV